MGVTFHIRDFFAPRRIWRLRRAFERTPYLPPDAMRRWQNTRLARVAAHAARHVPFWRDRFADLGLGPDDVRTVDDLAHLPLLDRETIRREGRRLWSEANLGRLNTVTTSGTSGIPLVLPMDRRANALEFVYYWRYWGWAGYRLGHRFAMFDPYTFLDPGREQAPYHWQPLLGRLLLNSVTLTADRVGDLIAGLRRYRPRFIKGHASDLYLLALLLNERGVTDVQFRGVFPTAEMLLPAPRRLMEETFGGLVLDSYGHMERTVAVCQCERGGYHINSDYGLLQIEDVQPRGPDHRPMGRVIGTGLHNLAMPLLRYDVGDLVEPHEDPYGCPCGRTLPLVRAIHGRAEDTVTTPDGRTVTALAWLFQQAPEAEFGQVIQDADDHVTARVVPGPDYDDSVETRLRRILAHFLGPAMRFDIDRITRADIRRTENGKVQLVIHEP